ncbi:MAG: hypothetical protein JY451_11555 [Erythrobacter sp.]|nr:MAG: hypothetical protein JY451_11555 [Erythrobacter sp.]
MGIAASSALRADTGANGPAYGSLEGLGGPRVFKKKPVLVLDPDELEAAHALFHDAGAELLGEEVERAPRPVSILGLAPMDDDPEELGHSDEVDDDADDDLPSPEAVLSLTRRKTPLPELDYVEDLEEEGYALGDFEALGELPADGFINDGLDLSTRIFPSLPIREVVEEELEEFTFRPVEVARPAVVIPPAPPAPVARAPEPPVTPLAPMPIRPAMVRHELPQVEAKAPVEPFAPVPEPRFIPPAPPEKLEAVPEKPRPARFEELNPAKDYETPEEVLDLDSWLAGAEQQSEPEPEPGPGPEAQAEPVADHTDHVDDNFDGYAFMRDQRPRRAVLQAAQEGRQSALRAKLLREAEQEAAEARKRKAEPSNSVLLRCWNWLRGLFG